MSDFTFSYEDEDTLTSSTDVDTSTPVDNTVSFEYISPVKTPREDDTSTDDVLKTYLSGREQEAIETGDRKLTVGDNEMLRQMDWREIYERAGEADEVGKWLSDTIKGRGDDESTKTILGSKYADWDGGFEQGVIPKGLKNKVELHDGYWKNLGRSAFNGVTLQWGDEIIGMATTSTDEEYDAFIKSHNTRTKQFQATDPIAAFVSEGIGMVGVSLLASPAVSVVGRGAGVAKAASAASNANSVTRGATQIGSAAALGATENVVYGAGLREGDEKTNMDALVEDGIEGMLFGGGLAVGLKALKSTVKVSASGLGILKDGVEALTGGSITTNGSKVNQALDKGLKRAGISRAQLSQATLDAIQNPKLDADGAPIPETIIGVVNRLDISSKSKAQFTQELVNAVSDSNDPNMLQLLDIPIREMGLRAANDAIEKANFIGKEGNYTHWEALQNALKDDSADVESTLKNIVEMMPAQSAQKFVSDLKLEPALLSNPKVLDDKINSLRSEIREAGQQVEKLYREMDGVTALEDVDRILDSGFRTRVDELSDNPVTPIDVSRLEKSLNSETILSSTGYKFKLGLEKGVQSKLVAPVRVQPTLAKALQANSRLAQKYNVAPDADGNFDVKIIDFDSDDISDLKQVDGFEDAFRAHNQGTANMRVDPPNVTGVEIRQALDTMRTGYADKNLNVDAEAVSTFTKAVNETIGTKVLGFNEARRLYHQLKSAERIIGTKDGDGTIEKFIQTTSPDQLRADITNMRPEDLLLAANRLFTTTNIEKMTKGADEVEARTMALRFVELSRGLNPEMTDDTATELVDNFMAKRAEITSLSEGIDLAGETFNFEGLSSTLKEMNTLPSQIARQDVTGKTVNDEFKRITADFDQYKENIDSFKELIRSTGVETNDVTQALDSLESDMVSVSNGFYNMFDTAVNEIVMRTLNDVDVDNVKDSVTAMRKLINSSKGKEMIKTSLEGRLNRQRVEGGEKIVVTEGQIQNEIADILRTMQTSIDQGDAINRMRKTGILTEEQGDRLGAAVEGSLKGSRQIGTNRSPLAVAGYMTTETMRLIFNRSGLVRPRLNEKENVVLLNALTTPLTEIDPIGAMRGFSDLVQEKPSEMPLMKYLDTNPGQKALLAALIIATQSTSSE